MSAARIGTQATWLQTQVLNNHSTRPLEKSLVEKVEEREARPLEVQANTFQASTLLCCGHAALPAHTSVTGGSLFYKGSHPIFGHFQTAGPPPIKPPRPTHLLRARTDLPPLPTSSLQRCRPMKGPTPCLAWAATGDTVEGVELLPSAPWAASASGASGLS